ncbi:hypothetical protein JCM5350_000502 [Sporobolomyces pararoseus]
MADQETVASLPTPSTSTVPESMTTLPSTSSSSSDPISTTQDATTNTTTETDTTTTADQPPPPMTKSALKRQRRQEQYESQKLLRRAREKEKKKQKAAEKRKLIEEGVIERPESKKRKKGDGASGDGVDERGKKIEHGARVVLDVGFDELMNEKEVKSMTSQVAYCYAANRNATNPFPILVSSFSGRLKEAYDKRKDHLNWKGVEWWEQGFEKLYENYKDETPQTFEEGTTTTKTTTATETGNSSEVPEQEKKEENLVEMGVHAGKPCSTAPKSSVVYLTGDSPNVLTSIDPGKTYVLGGIVDRNRYKLLCLNKAEKLGIQHAQLPIGEYLPEMSTRKVLTVNQVYEIMVNWAESLREKKEELRKEGKSEEEVEKEAKGDWREALRKVMPERKFDKDGKAKKRAEKRAEKQKQKQSEGEVYVVEVDDEEDDEDYGSGDDEQVEEKELKVSEGALAEVEPVVAKSVADSQENIA